jgi:uncharacterized protein (TIGR03067 family)
MENPHMLERPHLIGVLLAACFTLEFGARGDDDLAQGDLKAIQGEWTVPSGFGGDVTYTFKDRSLAIESPNRSYKMTIKVDSKSKPEKSIDFQIDEGPDDAKGKTSKGIYKFDGDDTLTLCFRGEGDRPKEFEQIGFEQNVTKWKRKKAASPKSDEKKPTASERAVEPKAADSDAPLPQGWPAATVPRKIEIKSYPAYRSAIVRAKNVTVRNSPVMFFSLFNHISKKGVEMTAPVVLTYESQIVEKEGEHGDVSMEFLYRSPDQGQVGPGIGAVKVEDFPATTFVCLGVQGDMTEQKLRDGVSRLRGWLQEHKVEWVAAGPPRRLGYHGPQTPAARQWNEVQIPVKPANPAGKPASPALGDSN